VLCAIGGRGDYSLGSCVKTDVGEAGEALGDDVGEAGEASGEDREEGRKEGGKREVERREGGKREGQLGRTSVVKAAAQGIVRTPRVSCTPAEFPTARLGPSRLAT
jgi:hypothetical protein